MPATPKRRKRRLILLDDNICDVGGQFFEVASLLLNGAQRLGYQPVLVTNASFDQPKVIDPNWKLHSLFHTRQLVNWSMGVDGSSNFQRDLSGKTIGGGTFDKLWSMKTDFMVPPVKRPKKMLDQWTSDFANLVAAIRPTGTDSLVINTGDDFTLLALAAALKESELAPMRIDVIFHFALYDPQRPDRKKRLKEIGRQIRATLQALKPHHVHLHATSDTLAAQLRETECGARVGSIPYPTRSRELEPGSGSSPLKAVLAGLPDLEKGKEGVSDLLAGVEKTHLKDGKFRISMQMPEDQWQTLIPNSLHRTYQVCVDRDASNGESASGSLEIMPCNLSTEDYHQWLDSADLGLFLHDADRHIARCSGALLEMMVRGVPVIVPDHCWLAEQVRMAGGHRSLGFIYQHRDEIPGLMLQFLRHREKIQTCATDYAKTIAKRHDGANTLAKMGIQPAVANRSVA